MSNIFNTNTRFAGLVEKSEYDKSNISVKLMKKMGWKEGNGLGKNQDGIKKPVEAVKRDSNSGIGFNVDDKKVNIFKDTSIRGNDFRERRQNRYVGESERQRILEQYQAEDNKRKELIKQEDERKKLESLKIENFPELVINKIENDFQLDESFINKLNKIEENKDEVIDSDLENLKPGWTMMKKDKTSGKIITKSIVRLNKVNPLIKSTPKSILDLLVELHQKRKDEYIELNGYDTWEKMFKFPNWRESEAELDEIFDETSENSFNDESENENEVE